MIEYNDVLNELQDYMLDEVNMQKSLRMKLVNDKSNIKKQDDNKIKKQDKKQDTIFIPNEQDSLFWCYFIIKNGEINYETTNNKNVLLTKQLKIDLVSVIRKNKDIIKMYKFDTITNIESNLANDNNINVKTFLTLCAINNINIIYVCKKTYYELLMNDSNQIYIVREVETKSKYYNKYGFELARENSLNTIKETLYKIDKIDKPIKGLTSYKVEELIDICNKLAIDICNKDTGKRKQKKDLYELIIQYF